MRHQWNVLIICLGIVMGFLVSCGQANSSDDSSAEDGTVTVSLINAPDGNHLWVFAYEENEWNTDMPESVLATQNGAITDDSADITLSSGCDDNWQPTGGVWQGTGGSTYDLRVYTTLDSAGSQLDRESNPSVIQVNISGDETVTVDYEDMPDYIQEDGTITVSIEGAAEQEGEYFNARVDSDAGLEASFETMPTITDGSASATVKEVEIVNNSPVWGNVFTGTGGTEYTVSILIDVDQSGGAPNTGDYVTDPYPVTLYQDGDKVMSTVYPDDYKQVE